MCWPGFPRISSQEGDACTIDILRECFQMKSISVREDRAGMPLGKEVGSSKVYP